MGESPRARPWTVYVLVVASFVGLVLSFLLDTDRSIWDFVSVPLSLWWAHALWTGKSWAYTLSFMGTTLCAFLLVTVALVQVFLMEMSVHHRVWWGLASSWFWLFLLIQPETKRFAGLDRSAPAEGVPTGS